MSEFKQLTDAQQIAETFGIVLGAASQSEAADKERLNSIAARMTKVVMSIATDESDAEAAQERFAAAIEVGKTVAEAGKIDPQASENALDRIEDELLAPARSGEA